MKLSVLAALSCLGFLLPSSQAQRPESDRRSPRDFFQRLPVMRALDADGNGEISTEEMTLAPKRLKTLDQNGDSRLSGSELRPVRPGRGQGRGRGGEGAQAWDFFKEKYDQDKDGKVTKGEYDRSPEVFTRLDRNGDDSLTEADWEGNDGGGRRGRRNRNGLSAPVEGESPPDFELTLVRDPETKVRLSDFKGKRPVALMFGSCT